MVENMQMMVYGGATGGGSLASDDLYLLDLRNGEEQTTWMTVPVIGTTPGRRYGHSLVFSRPHLIVFAGNTGSEPVNDVWSLNLEKSPFAWVKLEIRGDMPCVRVYHSAALCQTGSATGMIVIFGGRTSDQSALNDTWGLRRHRDGRWDWVRAPYRNPEVAPTPRYQHSTVFLASAMLVVGGRTNNVGESVAFEVYDTETSEWYKFPSVQRFRHACFTLDTWLYIHGGFEHETPNVPTSNITRIDTLRLFSGNANLLPRSYNEAAQQGQPARRPLGEQRPLPQAPEVVMETNPGRPSPLPIVIAPNEKGNPLHNLFVNHLLRPKDWNTPANSKFNFRREHIFALAEECERVIRAQPMVLRLSAPIKIFGDIHGQYADLMRFFDLYGSPTDKKKEGGDLEGFDYLFLGDFVDRGSHSLETICLLMSLKCKFPNQIHLIRGNHEDRWINHAFGFADECQIRLGEDPNDPKSIFQRINEMFEYLPLAAVIEDKVICLHGGIGSTLHSVEQIDALPRPLDVVHEVTNDLQQLVVDILWSDPTDSDQERGILPNVIRDPNGTGNIVKFGPDRVQDFLQENGLTKIIRAHECVMDGFERFAGGDLITVFSATDYCGRHKNAGAMLAFKKNLEIRPKLIYPVDNPYGSKWIDNEETLKKRPPTPPRWRNLGPRRNSYD
jgi:diadenosine tetraphosphatase ApaH/serine/threonine PP2A family protein phosphatase